MADKKCCCDEANENKTCCEEVNETENNAVDAEVCAQPENNCKCEDTDGLQKKIEELEASLAETKDMLLRTAAEYENFKRRETANREKTAGFVKAETIKALLPSIDNINRAIQADSDSPDYAKGLTMTVRSLTDALKKLGLEEINPKNEPFDVNFHQAVMRVEDDSVGENVVVEVLQPGYKLGDSVLRHAMVKVANCN